MVRMTAVALLALAFLLASPARAATTIVEYYNAALDHYFITWVPPEIAKLDAGTEIKGWIRTGKTLQTHTAAQGGTSPVCRYYIPPGLGDSHFFGRGTVECEATGAKNPSFVLEDPVFMHMFLPTAGTCPAGTTEVYRVFSNRPDANHRYMTDPAVRDEMIAKGWLAEGDGPNLVVMCAPPADTGPVTDFLPTAATTLAGAVNFATVTIPAGVTVTITDTLVLNATGPITIAGNLAGDCKGASLGTTATLTVSGNIDNHCSTLPDDAPPPLTLVATGGYDFNGGGTVRSSGDVLVTNNLAAAQTARIDASGLVVAPPSAPLAARIARAGPYACRSVSRTWIAAPAKARNGANGTPRSGDGKRASTWVLWCDDLGNGLIDRTTVTGQNGGDAGHATHTSNTGADATGGAGGAGGTLRVFVSGQLDIGTGNVFTTGSGGEGGDASATATANPVPAAAPSGTAVAGHGGVAGLVTIQSLEAMTIGSLTLDVGRGGAGGVAAATGADGAASTAARAAQAGGMATAVGGDGGALPPATLSAKGNITGAGAVTVTGGPAGTGGFGDAMSGRGGNGADAANKDGATGGGVHARGGHGGNAQTRNLAGALVANGGDSGEALFRGGRGGDGFADCALPMVAGGNGGRGGGATGGTYPGGMGIATGTAGITHEFTVGNGGNGGHGFGPGKRGEAGSNGIQIAGGTDIAPPVFTPGVAGRGCLVSVTVAVALDPLPSHEPFVGYSSIGFLVFRLDNDTGIVTITGDGTGKWIAVAGPYSAANGAFTATGSGTAAGFPSVPATFTGTLDRASGKLAGEVTLGGGGPGQLPQHSTSYTVTGNLVGPAP